MANAVDHALEHRIRSALNAVADLDALAVIVRVDEGRVRLTGELGSFAERLRAVEVATMLAGVGRVRNELTVRVAGSAWRIPDDELADSVRSTLRAVGAIAVTVLVHRHVVYLGGAVSSSAARAEVRHAVGGVAGVDFVDDATVVDGLPDGPLGGEPADLS